MRSHALVGGRTYTGTMMCVPCTSPVVDFFIDPVDAIEVMHQSFAEYSLKGAPSGAMLETAETLRACIADGTTRLAGVRSNGHLQAVTKFSNTKPGTVAFSRLAVLPTCRGLGYASLLVRALRELATAQGLVLTCTVRAEETGNIALYEHLGMEIISSGTRASLTGRVVDVVDMKDISARRTRS